MNANLRNKQGLAMAVCRSLLAAAVLVALAGCSEQSTGTTPESPATANAPDVPCCPAPTDPSPGPMTLDLQTPQAEFNEFAPEGQGHPTELQTNRRASVHLAGHVADLPATLWFDDQAAPGGESPLVFRMRPGGSGYQDFTFTPDGSAVRFTDAEGNDLAVMDVRLSVEPEGDNRTRTIFRLTLIKP